MTDTFEITLNNPLTEEQWDAITDVDLDRTDSVTFHTKHGKEVEFKKVRHGKWMPEDRTMDAYWVCSCCGFPLEAHEAFKIYKFCPNCGARMD